MADGTPYELPVVHLAKGGVDTVDINAALAQAPPSVQPHLSQFGSASVKYRYDWRGVVIATMSILDITRSLEYMPSFVFPATPAPADQGSDPPAQTYDGLWWRYGGASAGWVALANTADGPVGVEVGVSGLSAPAGRSLGLAAHGTTMLDLKDFFAGDPALVGGLHIAYSGKWGSVQVAGGLEDATKGFSADLPLAWHLPPTDSAGLRQLAAAGVMVNTQDPLLNFPASVSFTPYAFFRNISDTPKTLQFVVYYMDGRTVKSLPLADLTLQPGQAQGLPIGNLMASQTQIEAINLTYSYDGNWSDILAGIGSTDQTGNYVFPVSSSAAYKGGARASNYWLAAGGFDTMYTLWNPEPDAQELLVTLKYGDGLSYKLPVTLESHASAMVDIGELIRTQQLDQDGNILPPDVKHGSLVVSSPANEPEDAIDVAVGMGIYNPTKATCGGGCITCNGMVSPFFSQTPACIPVGDETQLIFGYNDNLGHRYNVSGWSNWSSTASTVMSVQTAGQPTPGLASGHSVGSASINVFDPTPVAVDDGQVCMYGIQPFCPTSTFQDGGNGCVTPDLESVYPPDVPAGQSSVSITLYGSGFSSGTPVVDIEQIGTYVGVGDDSSIYVSFPTTGTFLGDHDVTVSVNGQTSDVQELTVFGITYQGNLISGSSTATNAVVGQPIVLTGSPAGGTWQIPGVIYNTVAATASGYVTSPASQSSNPASFFWAGGGSPSGASQTVTYTLNGFAASAAFNLYGPSITSWNNPTQEPTVTGSFAQQVFGPWMNLTALVTAPANYPGTLSRVQVVNSLAASETLLGSVLPCLRSGNPAFPYLDAGNPYPASGPAPGGWIMTDDPSIGPLPVVPPQPSQVQETETFSAYLLWQANGASAVPLAEVNWGWNGTAASSSGIWTANKGSSIGPFTPVGPVYPTWTTTVTSTSMSATI